MWKTQDRQAAQRALQESAKRKDAGALLELRRTVSNNTQVNLGDLASFLDVMGDRMMRKQMPEVQDVATGATLVYKICASSTSPIDAEHKTYEMYCDYVRGIASKMEGPARAEALKILQRVFRYLDQHYTSAALHNGAQRTKVPTTRLWPGQSLEGAAVAICADQRWIPDFQAGPLGADGVVLPTAAEEEEDEEIRIAREVQEFETELANSDFDLNQQAESFDWETYEKLLRFHAGIGPGPFDGASKPAAFQAFQQAQCKSAPPEPRQPRVHIKPEEVPMPVAPEVDPDHHFPYPFKPAEDLTTSYAAAHHPMGSGPPLFARLFQTDEASDRTVDNFRNIFREEASFQDFHREYRHEALLDGSRQYEAILDGSLRYPGMRGSLHQSHFGVHVPARHAHCQEDVHRVERMFPPTAGASASFAPRRQGSSRYDDYTASLRSLPDCALGVPPTRRF